MHRCVHSPHDSGQSFATAVGLSLHWPWSFQSAHSALRSLQLSLHVDWSASSSHVSEPGQTPHERGHMSYMNAGFFQHCPSAVQPGQSSWRSTHARVHVPQETGHASVIKSVWLSRSKWCCQHHLTILGRDKNVTNLGLACWNLIDPRLNADLWARTAPIGKAQCCQNEDAAHQMIFLGHVIAKIGFTLLED